MKYFCVSLAFNGQVLVRAEELKDKDRFVNGGYVLDRNVQNILDHWNALGRGRYFYTFDEQAAYSVAKMCENHKAGTFVDA